MPIRVPQGSREATSNPLGPAVTAAETSSLPETSPARSQTRHFFDLFYIWFFPSHPFLLPREHLSEKLAKNDLGHLQAAIEYIGSCYDQLANRDQYRNQVEVLLQIQHQSPDGYVVQAMLLFAVGLHANNEQQKAEEVITYAGDIALAIGMDTYEFAVTNGEGAAVQEESWRRTWWELYMVDCLFAAFNRYAGARLNAFPADTAIPGEEDNYTSGTILERGNLQDLDHAAFSGSAEPFSSYTYRWQAARILAGVLPLGSTRFPDRGLVQLFDQRLSAWWMSLSKSRLQARDTEGHSNLLIFQAQTIALM